MLNRLLIITFYSLHFASANYCEIDGENCDKKSQVYKNIMFTDFQDFKIRERLDGDLAKLRNKMPDAEEAIIKTLNEHPNSTRGLLHYLALVLNKPHYTEEEVTVPLKRLLSRPIEEIKPDVYKQVWRWFSALVDQKKVENSSQIFEFSQVFVTVDPDNLDHRNLCARYGALTGNYRVSLNCLIDPVLPHIPISRTIPVEHINAPPIYSLLFEGLKTILLDSLDMSGQQKVKEVKRKTFQREKISKMDVREIEMFLREMDSCQEFKLKNVLLKLWND
ncbi:uncharacterized protein LOC111700650 [Eurytemora carolleeae]|uniref:uncharacterized protein LOC111700650 n=1 Tax=Eurytemora carolleeae TaxID=1294199 RepID=UPI000C7823AD|nr:uncharacterized protein LOC111700650 [Eurytemora carolleeae]|eukprot:XP_023327397.1 uncharacterized protein LOC111700650 [Eurytemora affinis]